MSKPYRPDRKYKRYLKRILQDPYFLFGYCGTTMLHIVSRDSPYQPSPT